MTLQDALELCRAKWGRGAFIELVALAKANPSGTESRAARARLSELEKIRPRYLDVTECPPTWTLAEYQRRSQERIAEFQKWEDEWRSLRDIAFPEEFIVGTDVRGSHLVRSERGRGHTLEEALSKAGLLPTGA